MLREILKFIPLFVATFSFGQNSYKKNAIFLEAGGNGLYGSLNYEKQVTTKPGLGARIGIGFYSQYTSWVTIPVAINYLFRIKDSTSFIDAGFGVTWTDHDEKSDGGLYYFNFVPSIGFRRHTLKYYMWRISVTPVVNKYGLVPWIGVSIGKIL